MGTNPPPINQNHEPTADGHPDENAQDNCVPASLAWVLEDLVGGTFDGDELKDAVYGQGSTGFEDAARYVPYAAAHGVTLSSYRSATQATLVEELHRHLDAGGDALVTIPSQWGTAPADPQHYSGYSHCVAMAYTLTGGLKAMNPWGGFWQEGTDQWWADRLVYGQIWLALKTPAPVAVAPAAPLLTTEPDGSVKDGHTGNAAWGPIARYIIAHGWESSDLILGEIAYDPEAHPLVRAAALSNGSVVRWDGTACDTNGAVVVAALHAQLDAATSKIALLSEQLAAAQKQLASAPPADPEAEAAKSALATLKAALAGV